MANIRTSDHDIARLMGGLKKVDNNLEKLNKAGLFEKATIAEAFPDIRQQFTVGKAAQQLKCGIGNAGRAAFPMRYRSTGHLQQLGGLLNTQSVFFPDLHKLFSINGLEWLAFVSFPLHLANILMGG